MYPGERPMKAPRKTLIAALAVMVGVAVPHGTAQGAAPTDPQIVGIVVAANQIDIDAGRLALSKSQNKQVRAFAQQMITDHSALQKSVSDLGAKLNVTPTESDTSNSLKKQAEQTEQKLNGLSGKAFDKAYIDNEVTYHKAVIDATKNVLIPNAQNPQLKSALTGAAPLFQGHLEHAEKVQSALQ
jgi:putative membrane protein